MTETKTRNKIGTEEEIDSWIIKPLNFYNKRIGQRLQILNQLFSNDYHVKAVRQQIGLEPMILLQHKTNGTWMLEQFDKEFEAMFVERLKVA